MTQWDFENKGKSGWTGTSSFVFEVPLRYLRPSVIYSVPCDWILQSVYWMTSSVDCNRKFSERIFSAPTIFKATHRHRQLPAHRAALMTKTVSIFPTFSSKFVNFAIQFCFRCKFSFHEKPRSSQVTVAWFFWTNQNSFATQINQWDCFIWIDNKLRQMAFFVFVKLSGVWGKGGLSSDVERFWNKNFFSVVGCFLTI